MGICSNIFISQKSRPKDIGNDPCWFINISQVCRPLNMPVIYIITKFGCYVFKFEFSA